MNKLRKVVDGGFKHDFVQCCTPSVPKEPRQRWMKCFAEDVAPHFNNRHKR